jgi:hypothetical protein
MKLEIHKRDDGMNTCANCKHLIYEDHQIWSDFPETELEKACDVRNGVGNLKQFPFKNTSCDKFELARHK